jgi:SWI/SNF-related matrix-associated actin-dependent regulator of chromatin subfamily A containing DEAD/H box 1
MTDAEIHHFCKRYKSVRKYALDEAKHLDAGKVAVLLRLLKQYIDEGRRVLVFSQVFLNEPSRLRPTLTIQ